MSDFGTPSVDPVRSRLVAGIRRTQVKSDRGTPIEIEDLQDHQSDALLAYDTQKNAIDGKLNKNRTLLWATGVVFTTLMSFVGGVALWLVTRVGDV